MIGSEFAHIHPPEDGSLHMMLPEGTVPQLVELDWAEQHPMAAAGISLQPRSWSTRQGTMRKSTLFSGSCACLMSLRAGNSGGSTTPFSSGTNRTTPVAGS